MCCGPMRGALLPTPPAEARPHQHRDRSAARASKRCVHGGLTAARDPRAFRLVKHRPAARAAHATQCGLGVVVLWPNAGRAPPHAVGQGSTAPTPRQVGGADLQSLWLLHSKLVWRAIRAHFTPGSIGRSPTRYARRTVRACLALLHCGPMRGALLPPPSAEDRPHQYRDRSAAQASKSLGHFVHILCRAARALFAL